MNETSGEIERGEKTRLVSCCPTKGLFGCSNSGCDPISTVTKKK